MKDMTENMTENQTCELIQLSISDTIDTNESLSPTDANHIKSCPECAEFHQLWQPKSPIATIASGSLIEQLNLTQPIISQLEMDAKTVPLNQNNVHRGKFLKLASIAAVIAIVGTFSFHEMNQEQSNITDNNTPEETLNLKIPKLDLTLTEAKIEQSIGENYQNLSESATEKWKTATTGIARATEYIANGTHYISTKYLAPPSNGTNGPQSRLTPQQDEPNPLQYG